VNKAVVLFAYGTAVFFILRKAYQEGHTGIPEPSLLAPPTYLYGILALSADFLGTFPVVIAVALTFGLMWGYQDMADGKTVNGRFIGTVLAPKIKSSEKRTAQKRNTNAQKQVPKVSPGGRR
jgi:hypothetical protein